MFSSYIFYLLFLTSSYYFLTEEERSFHLERNVSKHNSMFETPQRSKHYNSFKALIYYIGA